MSDVLVKVAERKRPETDVIIDLESKPLSAVLRASTWRSHTRAEYSDFEQALVQGVLPRDAYAELMAQSYFIYVALEQAAATMADHPVAGRMCFAELARTAAIEADLAFYYGPQWRDAIAPLPITQEYCDRITEATAAGPGGFIAHHYTRYLADLSGGVYIDRAIASAYGLDEDGRRFYSFDIPDFDAFKQGYRKLIDELPLTQAEQLALIDEAAVAYEFNIELVDQLTQRFGPFEGLDRSEQAGHGHGYHQ
jgi:heme oxygenase